MFTDSSSVTRSAGSTLVVHSLLSGNGSGTHSPTYRSRRARAQRALKRLVQVPPILVGSHFASPSIHLTHRGKHMTTGYRDGVTTPDHDYCALERRLAYLEDRFERTEREAADRRAFWGFIAYSMLIAIELAAVVLLASLPN